MQAQVRTSLVYTGQFYDISMQRIGIRMSSLVTDVVFIGHVILH